MSKSTPELTKERQEEFIRRFEEGDFTVEKTAELVGISRQCVYQWKRANPEFAVAIESLQEIGADATTEKIEQNIKEWAMNPTFKVGMVNFLAAMAWLKAHKPAKWNEKSFKFVDKRVTITRVETVKDYGKNITTREVRELPVGLDDNQN